MCNKNLDTVEAAQKGLEALVAVLSGVPIGANVLAMDWNYQSIDGNGGQLAAIHLGHGITNICKDSGTKAVKLVEFDRKNEDYKNQLMYIENGVFVFQLLSQKAEMYYRMNGTLRGMEDEGPLDDGGESND